MNDFNIISISENEIDSIEQLGTKYKFWFKKDDIDSLFKRGRENTGENWVEVVVSKIFEQLNIPHANYYFAEFGDNIGTVCETFVPAGARLTHGNELLARAYERIEEDYDITSYYRVRKYNLRLIILILNDIKLLPAFDLIAHDYCESASDMFIGYIIMDCLISNQDRHHENWGLIRYGNTIFLAPSYDHASGLGSKVSDEDKEKRLKTKDLQFNVASFVKKAKTPFYDNKGKILKTIDSVKLCGKINKKTTIMWLEKIETLDINEIERGFLQIPTDLMSDISKVFAIKMLNENMKRLAIFKEELLNE